MVTVSFKLNGKPVAAIAGPVESLRDLLREKLQVHSVKAGCGQGGCGSCTVLMNGEPVVSCLTPAVVAEGQDITTLDGIGTPAKLHPLQAAFYDNFAAQCGYCTSGMITVAKALLDHNPHPSREEIVEALAGNVCRCTGYVPIIAAIQEAAARMDGRRLMKELGIVGQSVKRRDGIGHVTGQTQYVDDVSYPNMLWLRMVRSPVARGKIRKLDVSKAEAFPGVSAVITWKDVPNNWYTILCLIGVEPNDEPVLAHEEVMWQGEPICAIIAETEEIAREAIGLVELEIEEQEPVLDVFEAIKPGAPVIKKWGANTFTYENGAPMRRVRFGDVDKGFAEADTIIEGTYRTTPYEHVPLETQTCVVKPEPDGRLTIHTNTQALYFTMDNTAIILQVPSNRLHMIGGTVGGGFGGKVDVVIEPVTAIAAMKTGRPVKWRWTRTEEFQVSSTSGAWHMEYKDGVMKDGRIIARKVRSLHDAGAYHRHSPYGVTKHSANLPGPYYIPNVWVDAYCVYTNRQPASALRGFGVTPASYAVEVQMDKIARTIGMDPWEIRFINAYRNGQTKAIRKVVEDATLIETLQAAAKLVGHPLAEKFLAMHSNDWKGAQP